MTLAFHGTIPSNERRSRPRRATARRLGAGFLAFSVYGTFALGHASTGCRDLECEHDWQCGDSAICIPYDGENQCFDAPVCTDSAQCPNAKGCIVRSSRLVNDGPRDPFTSDEPGKRTCGGYSGPPEPDPVEPSGCGFTVGNHTGGAGGSGGSSSSSSSKSSSTQSSGSSGGAGSTGSAGGAGSTGSSGGAGTTASGTAATGVGGGG